MNQQIMSAIKPVEVKFPGRTYCLVPEREENLTKECGFYFPNEIKDRTLCLMGLSGTGKSYVKEELCKKANIMWDEQVSILFQEAPKVVRGSFKTIEDLATRKVIEGHFMFKFPEIKRRDKYYPHAKEICNLDYSKLELPNNFQLGSLKDKFVFEFRQFEPELIRFMRWRRAQKHTGEKTLGYPDFKNQSDDEINKAEYLLYQAAYKLFEQGADVYVRTGLKGRPLRFLK